MTKVVLLGDLHLGARGGSNHFSDYFNSFFTDTLYPYCQVNDIKNIIQLGDLFDSRTSLSYKAFHRCKNVWFDSLRKKRIKKLLSIRLLSPTNEASEFPPTCRVKHGH